MTRGTLLRAEGWNGRVNTNSRNFTAKERQKCGKTFDYWNGREK